MSLALNSRLGAPKVWMKRRSSPCTLTINVWLSFKCGVGFEARYLDVSFAQKIADHSAEDIVADTSDHGRAHLHLGEINRHIGRAAADGLFVAFRHHQLARRRQVSNRRGRRGRQR